MTPKLRLKTSAAEGVANFEAKRLSRNFARPTPRRLFVATAGTLSPPLKMLPALPPAITFCKPVNQSDPPAARLQSGDPEPTGV